MINANRLQAKKGVLGTLGGKRGAIWNKVKLFLEL